MNKLGPRAQWVLFLILGLGLMHAAGAAQFDHPQNLISLNIRETDINEVYEMLSRQGRTNIILSQGVEGDVSINLYDVTVEKAVNLVALAAGFVVEKMKDTYFVSNLV